MLANEKSWRLLRKIAPAAQYPGFHRNLKSYRVDQYIGAFQHPRYARRTHEKKNTLVRTLHMPSLLAIAVVSLAAVGRADDDTTKEQNEIRKMVQNTLQRLYKADPKTKAAIEGAAGYAIVSNMRVEIFVAGPGRGKGITVNNKSKSETFMKRIELQAGLGFGVKKVRLIFVFDNERALHRFVNSGWDLSGPATAAAKAGQKGRVGTGAAPVSDGVWMYQLTDRL
jgi:lipid-binding SYLF domain-containing protein